MWTTTGQRRRWELDDGQGYTAAHATAYLGDLPETFTQWDLTDKSGCTVTDEIERFARMTRPAPQ